MQTVTYRMRASTYTVKNGEMFSTPGPIKGVHDQFTYIASSCHAICVQIKLLRDVAKFRG